MLASLEEAYQFVCTTPRRRLRNQAHWRLNQAYFDLIFAWGCAQSGQRERSAELHHAATRVLPSTDPVHQTLLKAFTMRIAETSSSPWTPLAIDLSALEDFARYKVCRALQFLAILSRIEFWDPMGDFWRSSQTNQKPVQVSDVVTSILLADGEGTTADVVTGIRALALAHSNDAGGASLIGPSQRAGCLPEVVSLLERADNPTRREQLEAARFAVGGARPGASALFREPVPIGDGPQRHSRSSGASRLDLARGRTHQAALADGG